MGASRNSPAPESLLQGRLIAGGNTDVNSVSLITAARVRIEMVIIIADVARKMRIESVLEVDADQVDLFVLISKIAAVDGRVLELAKNASHQLGRNLMVNVG